MLETFFEIVGKIGGVLWGPWTFFGLLGAGVLFSIWTKFTQYRSMTHGFAVIRGVYDDPDDPGAINHFQALSAALSATIGLGNIGGVALAVGVGGPGSLVWMWLTGVLGMAIKTVEITLSQMYRNVDDPDNPHGGAMWVVEKVVASKGGGWRIFGRTVGVFFCITLLISAITGGNMFQSWNVADVSKMFWNVPPIVTGIALAIVVGLVIIGGIKRIGTVAGRLVPFMCILYVLSALAILAMHIPDIPAMFALIFRSAFSPAEATGAFLGGTAGWAFSTGLRRALFSNEAGQGSAPIAHAAAKTDEPAREGIIGGIGPFIDTLCICSLTGLVILCTGTWDRPPLEKFVTPPVVSPAFAFADSPLQNPSDEAKPGTEVYMPITPPDTGDDMPPASGRMKGKLAKGEDRQLVVEWETYNAFDPPTEGTLEIMTRGKLEQPDFAVGRIAAMPAAERAVDNRDTDDPADDVPKWGLLTRPHPVEIPPDKEFLWNHLDEVFTIVEADRNPDSNKYSSKSDFRRWKLLGNATMEGKGGQRTVTIEWKTLTSESEPSLVEPSGFWRNYNGASLTAHAFDREFPGLGKILLPIAAWLFAISTMISWSYYGEQGMIYMLGQRSVIWYKLFYLFAIIFAAVWIKKTADMENLMDLGTGAMLWSNLPIIVVLGFLAVRCLAQYDRKLKAGEFPRHRAPDIEDVVGGKDVEKKD
jgi:AGCS family alanine or glycine:cation symporter